MKFGAVDLFCGIGGLTYGLQKSGINVVAGIDLDSTCEYGFIENNNSQFINKSVNDITGKDIDNFLKDFDVKVLVGCAPCQPFSNHQKDKKNRKKHKDWSLLYQYGRLIEECSPDIVSMENVPQLMKEKVFKDFVKSLKRLEFNVSYSIVNVADYGVPQRRKRLILLACKSKMINLLPPTHKKYVCVKDVISGLPSVSAGEKCLSDKLHVTQSLSALNIKRIKASSPNGTWRDWPDELRLKCHKAESGESYASVYGRMAWDGLSPTITTQFNCYGTGRFGHPEQDRAITLREGAILQSFPPRYKFIKEDEEINQKNIAKHIGNAVPPRLGEIIGKSIISSYSIT
jgi:DNA (cytosine-5)-methyltransferase 1